MFDFMASEKEIAEIKEDVETPKTNCSCLNSRVAYQVHTALSESMDDADDSLKKLMKRIKKEDNPGKRELLEQQYEIIQGHTLETSQVLGVINAIPTCKE